MSLPSRPVCQPPAAVAGTTASAETRVPYVGVLEDFDWDGGQVA